MLEGISAEQRRMIPNGMLDGINENGVFGCLNVVPKNDADPVTGTNPGGFRISSGNVLRYVFDRAESADNAVEIMRSLDIHGLNLEDAFELHWMIADPEKTYIVEIIGNKVVAEEKTGDEILNDEKLWLSEIFSKSQAAAIREGLEAGNPLPSEIKEMISGYVEGTKDAVENERRSDDTSCWITIHNCTYDLKDKKVRVILHEDDSLTFDFVL